MIASTDIQNEYVNLYKILRNYLWSNDVIEIIADLETSVYEAFPSIDEIRRHFKDLKYELYDALQDDEEMRDAVDAFEEIIKEDIGYSRLERVQEVIDNVN